MRNACSRPQRARCGSGIGRSHWAEIEPSHRGALFRAVPVAAGGLLAHAIAAYARHLETEGGRGGRPAALAIRRVYLSLVRALARELGADGVAAGVKVPRHRALELVPDEGDERGHRAER